MEGWRKPNVTSTSQKGREDPGNCRHSSLTSIPGKLMEELILGGISRHIKNDRSGEAKLSQLDQLLPAVPW